VSLVRIRRVKSSKRYLGGKRVYVRGAFEALSWIHVFTC